MLTPSPPVPGTSPPTAERPAPGVIRFSVPLALESPDTLNCHVIEAPDGPLLVDCGTAGSERAVAGALAAAGITPAGVLVTHGHIDHWGCATVFSEAVSAHPEVEMSMRFAREGVDADYGLEDAERRAMEEAFGGFRKLITGVPEILPLADGQRLGDWEVLWTPGHDPGHICLWRASDGVLLCGDLLLPGLTPNIQPAPGHTDTLQEFFDSLERVAALPVRLVLPAHGSPYEAARQRADELRAHHRQRLAEIIALITDEVRSVEEIAVRVFGDQLDPGDRMLAAMETQAHLSHLELGGRAALGSDGWRAS